MTEIMPVPRNSHITVLRPPSICPAFIGALLDEGVKKTCRWQVFSPRVPARRTGARSANGESAPKGEVQQKKQDI